MVSTSRAKKWLRRATVAAVVLALLLAAVIAAIHTAPVRAVVLRRAAGYLAARFELLLRADSLRYNLFTGRVSLSNVTLAAAHAPQDPFLTADLLAVTVPPSLLFGTVAIERVRLENAGFAWHRLADGSSNLPRGEASASEEPPSPVYIERLEIPRLAVSVTDESTGVVLSLPNLSVDVGRQAGQLRLVEPGRLSRGANATTINALDGGVAFDGRALHLTRFNAAVDEATLTLDGEIAVLVSEPRLDLRVSGTSDVAAAARWATSETAPAGRVAFDATVAGPLSSPGIAAHVRSDAIAYADVTLADFDADVTADENRLEASRVELSLAGGRVNAAGSVAFDSGEVRADASWADIGVARLVRMLAPSAPSLPAGRATGRGSFAGVPADAAGWMLDVSNDIARDAAGRGRLPVEGSSSFGVSSGRWRFEGTHLVAGARVRAALAGALDPESLSRSSLTGTVEAVDADLSRVSAALEEAGILETSVRDTISGELDAAASLSGSLARPAVQLNVSGQGLSAFDVADIGIDAKTSGNLERSVVEARVSQGAANVVQLTGTVWPDEARIDAHVEGTIGDIPALARGMPIGGVAELRLDARGPFDAIAANGTMSVSGARYDEVPLGPLEAQFVVDAGMARIDVTASDFGARANANIGLREPRSAVVDLQVRDAQVDRLIAAAGVEAGVTGTLSLTAHAEGTIDDWQRAVAAVEIEAFDGRMDDLPIRLQQPARVWYDGSTVDVVSLEAALGETRLSIAGRYSLEEGTVIAPGDALRGVLIGDLSHIVDALRSSGLADTVPVAGQGPVVVLTRVTGTGRQPVLSADLELGPAELATMELPPFRQVQVRARVADGAAEIVSATAEWQKALIDFRARVPLALAESYLPGGLFAPAAGADGMASLDLRATSISSEALAPFLPPDAVAEIQGQLDAVVHLEASSLDLASLDGEARLDRADLTVAGVSLTQQQPTRIVIENGIARIASWNWTGRGTSLIAQGEVRLPDRRAAVLAGGQIDLRLLTPFLPAGMSVGGTLAPRVSVSGPFDDLRVEGDVTLAEGEIRMRDPDVIVTGLSATALLERDRARINSLQGQINGGALAGSGEITYGAPAGLGGSLHSTIAGMGLEFPAGLRSELDADLTLELTSEDDAPAGTLNGTVTVVRSSYREPIAVVTQLLSALRTERLATAVSAEPTFADRLRLNVRVLTDSDVIVDNNLARLQLGADLRLIGTAAAPALSGRATLREGGELYLGRNRYTVESGTIDFANPVTVEPALNVQAYTRAGGEDIELTLKGTPETLSVDLRSTSAPELGQADIASLLLTGRTLNEVSGNEAEIVGEQVLSYLSGDVLGAASRVIGLDTIRLGGVDPSLRRRDSAEIASEADPTSRLTFGKSLGNSLEITLSQSLREGGAQTWILDYVPISRVNLRFVSDDENLRSYQFRHDVTIGDTGARRRSAAARPERETPQVAAVTFTGDLGGPEERLRRVLELEPGDEFEFSRWQDDRERIEGVLHDEGRLEARVSVRRDDTAEGVALTYQVDAGPLTEIRFSGFSPPSETIRAVEAAWTRAIFDEALVDEVEDIVRRALNERGYLQPAVEATVASAGSTKTLEIAVQSGERARGRRVAVDAGDEALARDLEQWVDGADLEDLAWQDPAAFQRALAGELRRRGHVSPEITVAPPRADGAVAVVRVDVRAGPVVTLREVQVMGSGRVPDERVREAAGLEPGTPYDPAAVDSARDRVARLLRGEGFAEARVEVKAAFDGEQAIVTFVLDEGPQQVLSEIAVSGTRQIARDVVVDALGLSTGDPLGVDAWLRARSRLFDTALFRRVDVTAESIGEPADDRQPMRLLVNVEEWPALRVRYGFQLSEERPESDPEGRDLTPGVSADITRRTLFGRAITIGAAAEYQRRERLARGFLNTPTLLGLPVESILTVERSRLDFAEAQVITDRSSASWEQRIRLGTPLRLSYGYRYDRDHTFSTRPPDPLNPPFDETVNVARLTAAAVFDTRDNPLDTTRGWLVSSNVEYAAASLGSDIRFVRYLAQAYRFQPVGRVVLASAARLGLATALDGQSLLPSERFFAGGARSVRGVAENSLGPRDIFGDVAGGGALVVFNQEVRVPLYRWFSGVGFLDVGNVFERPRAIDLGDLVGSFGAGLRVSTPFALLRADVARLWSPDTGQSIARWSFGIGQTF